MLNLKKLLPWGLNLGINSLYSWGLKHPEMVGEQQKNLTVTSMS